ncbi:hypothetical protein VNI00_007784 [Paramarasmius palmivorus]|uniref:Uncharacterized protein n=1 Tax=Paramarasmius palmivorus TaxID=297713 RepID=A0AAW0D135_9AGAR
MNTSRSSSTSSADDSRERQEINARVSSKNLSSVDSFLVEPQLNSDVTLQSQRSRGTYEYKKLTTSTKITPSSPTSLTERQRSNMLNTRSPGLHDQAAVDRDTEVRSGIYMREASKESGRSLGNDGHVPSATSLRSPEHSRAVVTSTLPRLQTSGSGRRQSHTESCAATPPEDRAISTPCVDRAHSSISDMNSVTKLTKTPSRSLTNRALTDLSNRSLNVSPLPPSTNSPPLQRSLRRKKHLSVLRMSAPLPTHTKSSPILPTTPVTPRPQSQPFLTKSHATSSPESVATLSVPITNLHTHARAYSQPNVPRIGHPSRPYYSVIRKDVMSPPSPGTMPTPPLFIFTAPSTGDHLTHSELEDDDDFAQGCVGMRKVRHRSAPTLSQRERAALKLALEKGAQSPEEDDDSVLDMDRPLARTDTLKRKVNKLRRGIRDIWRRRS